MWHSGNVKCRNYRQICTAVACRRKSIGHACKRNDTCANTCDLHVGFTVQIMHFAIVRKIFIVVCNLCGKYFSLMDLWRNMFIGLHSCSISMFKIVTATNWDVMRWVVSLKITLCTFLTMTFLAVSGRSTSCFNASTPSASLRYPLDTRLRSFLGQCGRGSRRNSVSLTTVDPRLPHHIQSLYCVRLA